jgi:uncharacterized repeat protein (TIGR01451 family)
MRRSGFYSPHPGLALGRAKWSSHLGLWLLLPLLITLISSPAAAEPGPTLTATGSYTGNGGNSRSITGLSFRPDFVIVKHDGSDGAVCRLRDMPAGKSKHLNGSGSFSDNRILELVDDGFTVGSDRDVNNSGASYYWVAFRASDELVLGSYTGDGLDDREIAGIGLDPELVLILAENRLPWHSSSAVFAGWSLPFEQTTPRENVIQALGGGGFQVGDDDDVNHDGDTYYYLAFAAAAGRQAVGGYWGDGQDNRDITGLGFQPDYVWLKSSSSVSGVQRPAALGGDRSLYFMDFPGFANGIQELHADGFQVGNASSVNQSSRKYYWFAARTEPYTNLLVGLVASDPTPVEGQEITLAMAVKNYGPEAASSVEVTLSLPAGLTFISATPATGTYDEGSGIWSLASLPAGFSTFVQVVARVDLGTAGQTLDSSATLSGLDIIDGIAADNSYTAPVTVQSADLALSLGASDLLPGEGDAVTFTLRVDNLGADSASGVELDLPLVPGLSYTSHGAGQGSYLPGSGRWQLGTLPMGAAATLTVEATLDAGTSGSLILQTASRVLSSPTDPDADNDTDAVTLVVIGEITVTSLTAVADSWIKESSADDINGTDDEVRVKNKVGDLHQALYRFDLSDPPPAAAIQSATLALWVNAKDDQGPIGLHRVTAPWDEMTVTWNTFAGAYEVSPFASIQADANGALLVDVTDQVRAWVAGDDANQGLLLAATSDEKESKFATREEGSADRRPTLHIVSIGDADLSLGLSVDDLSPDEGQTLRLSLALTNAGPELATDVQVRELLPPELTFLGATSSSGSYNAGSGIWSLDAMAVGSDTLRIDARLAMGTGGSTVTDSAAVIALNQNDSTTEDWTASVDLDVQLAELALAMTVDDSHPAEGDTPGYRLVLRNGGPDTATGIVLSDSLPPGLLHQSDTPSQGAYDSVTGLWAVGAVAAGDSATLEIDALVAAGTGGDWLRKVARITAVDQADHAAADVSSSAWTWPSWPGRAPVCAWVCRPIRAIRPSVWPAATTGPWTRTCPVRCSRC